MLDEDCATELLDFTEELLEAGFVDELLATLFEDEETFDEDEISSIDAKTFTLPDTVFVLP